MFIIIGIIVLIYLIALLVKIVKKPTSTFVVEKGKIYQEEFTEGYIIRDETIINKENTNDKIVPIKSEGEKVAKGESIYRYCIENEDEINKKIEDIDIEIQKNLNNDDTYFSTDIKLMNNQIDKKLSEICESNNLNKISQGKTEINTYLTKKMKVKAENSNNETLKKLVSERNSYENQLNNNSRYIVADTSGVISYRVDGLENTLKSGDFSYLSEQYLKNLDIQTGQIVALSNNSGKIVDNFQCNVVCILNSEEARNSEVGKSIKIRLQNSEEIPAKIVYKASEDNNKVLLVFEINNDVAELIKYRKTSFDVIWWSDSGLKIPNSAIKYEGNIAYVIRNRAGLKEKIFVKILRSNDKYSIVENYSYSELKDAGYDTTGISSKKSISVFDQIEN
ncbi:putative uncharacterized protein [Clostridium sp. CAG:492]|mgnify:CR=1 FL=1|nr:putative uncharacterized protein [Clostridium sp. CAG:492]